MVSIEQTRKKYHGRKAETYDAVRGRQQRWALENAAVEKLLDIPNGPKSILDCPVGTGRFLPLYRKLGIEDVTGIDASDTMLALARRKRRTGAPVFVLHVGDATGLVDPSGQPYEQGAFDAAVCVRFLDLIDQDAMRRVVTELCRVTRRAIVLTIRLGDVYVPKVNTATHARKGFNLLIARLGWRVEQSVPVFDAGWVVMRLGRK